MFRPMLQGCPEVLERKCTRTHDDYPLAPKLEVRQLVGIAITDVSAEVRFIFEDNVAPFTNATVDREQDKLAVDLVLALPLDALRCHHPGVVGLLLCFHDLPTAACAAVGMLCENRVDIAHDVVCWRVVLIGPGRRALLVYYPVPDLGRVDPRVDVRIMPPDTADGLSFVKQYHRKALLHKLPRRAYTCNSRAHNHDVDGLWQRPIRRSNIRQHARIIDVFFDAVRFRDLRNLFE
mmetsp:Transcript_69075/g.174122  ORF Transcript_69075/g.174122 Transcript_69075/m.174122 type:complete len:235 (-) Transcript_69075:1192-1896(-)